MAMPNTFVPVDFVSRDLIPMDFVSGDLIPGTILEAGLPHRGNSEPSQNPQMNLVRPGSPVNIKSV